MPKEILLYSPIYSFTAEDYIRELEANKSTAIVVRMNCPGGDVLATYGMIAKFQEHSKGKKIQVDGMAKSCGFFMCYAADEVECLDVSEFLAHRASYGSWIENDPERFTAEMKESLNKTNQALRAIIESKTTSQKFFAVTGISLDAMFSLESRIDVPITAAQAKELGLVTKINPLTATKKAEVMALSSQYGIAAFSKEPIIITNENISAMTLQEFKAAHPAIYAEAVKEGTTAEQSRVAALMVYNDVDPEAVATAIKEGKSLDNVMIAEMGKKMFSKNKITAIGADNAPEVKTAEELAAKTAEETNKATFDAEVKANLKKFI